VASAFLGGAPVRTTVETVFEDGVFKPVEQPEIPEGEHVCLTVQTAARPEHEDPLDLAASVYRGLRPEKIDQIEGTALDRVRIFPGSRW
jgi:predicted DNA-binding antitoxin AbrB/MazE fold protein